MLRPANCLVRATAMLFLVMILSVGQSCSSDSQTKPVGDAADVTTAPDSRQTGGDGVTNELCPNPGAPQFLHQVSDGEGGVVGMQSPCSVVIAPDNVTLYVGGCESNSLSVFRREPASGEVTLVQTLRDGLDGADMLDDPEDLWLSPDGRQLLVGVTEGLALFDVDSESGKLTPGEPIDIPCDESGGWCWRGGEFSGTSSGDLIAANRGEYLVLLERNADTGVLSLLLMRTEAELAALTGHPVEWVKDTALSPDGDYLYLATGSGSMPNGKVDVLAVDRTSGELSAASHFSAEQTAIEFGPYAGERWPWQLAMRPDGQQLYAWDESFGIVVLARDTGSGELSFLERREVSADVAGASEAMMYDVVPSPDNSCLYATVEFVLGEPGLGIPPVAHLMRYPVAPQTGLLGEPDATSSTVWADMELNFAWNFAEAGKLAIGGDQDWLVVTLESWRDSVALASLDLAGKPDAIGLVSHGDGGADGLYRVWFVGRGPGHSFTAVSSVDETITVYSVSEHGQLVETQKLVGGEGGTEPFENIGQVAITPDGDDLYIFNGSEGACGSSRFSAGEDRWTWEGKSGDLVVGDDCLLDNWHGMVFSPEGDSLYLLAYGGTYCPAPCAVHHLWRDSVTGELTFQQSYANEAAGDQRAMVVTPDGRHAYLGGLRAPGPGGGGPVLTAFERLANGTLKEMTGAVDIPDAESWQTGSTIKVASMAVSPNGLSVVVGLGGGGWPDELWLFSRTAVTGVLAGATPLDLSELSPLGTSVGPSAFGNGGSALLTLTGAGLVRFSVHPDDDGVPQFELTGVQDGGLGGVPSLPSFLLNMSARALSISGEHLLLANGSRSSVMLFATDSCP